MNRFNFFFLLLGVLGLGLWGSSSLKAQDLDPVLVKRWMDLQASKVKTMSADFIQERHLKGVSKPLTSPGKFWFKAPTHFRWQVGEPEQNLALATPEEFITADLTKKKVERWTSEAIDREGDDSRAGFVRASMPRSYADFVNAFTLEQTGKDAAGNLTWFSATPKSRKIAMAVSRMVFHVTGENLSVIEVQFKNGGKIVTRIQSLKVNSAIQDQVFSYDLSGLSIKDHR